MFARKRKFSGSVSLSVLCLVFSTNVTPVEAQPVEFGHAPVSSEYPSSTKFGSIDFVRPTKELRGADAHGCGGFRCPRGGRSHMANDYVCEPGVVVIASADGLVTRVGLSKTGYPDLQYVKVRVDGKVSFATHYLHDVTVVEGELIRTGQAIGRCADLKVPYPNAAGMKNHVHQYVYLNGQKIDAETHPMFEVRSP